MAITLLIVYIVLDFFTLQPLVPKVQSTDGDKPEDYLVWLHDVNNAYQQHMITFAENYTHPYTPFAIDYYGTDPVEALLGHTYGIAS